MAMLMLNDVFRRTWGDRPGPVPESEYWTDVISAVRAVHPEMLFAAEAYWDLEWQLLQLGFDYCYDKRLYDRLLHEPAPAVRDHLAADLDFQQHLLRFTENHDEPRAACELPQRGTPSRRGHRRHPARRHAVARRSVRGMADPRSRPPRTTTRPKPMTPISAASTSVSSRSPTSSATACGSDAKRPAGPTTTPSTSCWRGAGRPRPDAASSSSTTPTTRPPRWSASRGTTSPAPRGGSTTCSTATPTIRDGDDMERSGLYVALPPRAYHVFRWTPTRTPD